MNDDQTPDLEKIGIKTGDNPNIKIKKLIVKKEPMPIQPQTLWDVSSDDLFLENDHCRKQKREVYSNRFIPMAVTLGGFAISIYLIIYFVFPNMFVLKHTDWYFVYAVILLSILPATLWLNRVRKRDDKLIAYYRERSELIIHILRIRGDL